MRWNVLLIIVIALMIVPVAFAQPQLSAKILDNNIALGEKAEFELTIKNVGQSTQQYILYSLQSGQGWNVNPDDLQDKTIRLDPGASKVTKIIAEPVEDFTPGIYYVHVTVDSDQGDSETISLKIYLGSDKPVEYLPVIKADIDMDEKIDPKNPMSIKLFLENRNPLNLTGLKIEMQSDMEEFKKELSVDLPPLEKKTVEFSVKPNPFQQPKDYTLFFVFKRHGETVKVVDKTVEIITLVPEFVVEPVFKREGLKTTITVNARNPGNVKNTQTVRVEFPLWRSILTSSTGKSEKIDGVRYLTWEKSLSPNESTTFSAVTNYWTLVYILIAILLITGFYFYTKSPIVVKKKAKTTKSGENGALSEIKITMEIRNRSKKPLKSVTVTDLVPGIANVAKSLELGTLKPQDIKNTKKGTKVVWSLAEIDAHEHRLITYKVKAKLNIVGTFSLPRSTVTYKNKKGKAGKVFSNIFKLSS